MLVREGRSLWRRERSFVRIISGCSVVVLCEWCLDWERAVVFWQGQVVPKQGVEDREGGAFSS